MGHGWPWIFRAHRIQTVWPHLSQATGLRWSRTLISSMQIGQSSESARARSTSPLANCSSTPESVRNCLTAPMSSTLNPAISLEIGAVSSSCFKKHHRTLCGWEQNCRSCARAPRDCVMCLGPDFCTCCPKEVSSQWYTARSSASIFTGTVWCRTAGIDITGRPLGYFWFLRCRTMRGLSSAAAPSSCAFRVSALQRLTFVA
mmetsp:Transcript_95379/g.160217  ORF Transcript_95379/g.160217 Transcript_95379/m.160217 type:complete len:202 (+) Transcript_95379:419-1024(+)